MGALWLLPLGFLGVFYFYPLITILGVSLAPEGVLDVGSFAEIVTSATYRRTFGFTLGQAALSTGLTLALALPGAYVFARYSFPGKRILLALAILPFVLPTVVVAAAFSALVGPRGLLNTLLMDLLALDAPPVQLDQTLAIILIAHVFYNYPLALRVISSFWANQSPRQEEAARVLGVWGWRLWWRVRLPILRPAILAAGVLIFIFTFTSFGVILILGGPRFATLEVEIYRQATGLFNLPLTAALALVQMGAMFLMLAFYTRLQRQLPTDLARTEHVARRPESRRQWALIGGNIALMAGLLFLPLLALLTRSLTVGADGLTLQHYAALSVNERRSILFVPPLEAVGNSLVFALTTMVLAVLLGLIVSTLLARGGGSRLTRWLDPVFMLPLATSAVTLGFGYLIALDEPPLNLRASPALLPLAHTLVALPFVVRSVLPALRGIPPQTREAARVLGAPPWQVWRRVDLPLMGRGLIVGATFAFTVSMGEFGASVFVARPETPTLPVAIYRLLGQPGATHYGQALALSVILAGVCALSFLIIDRLGAAGVGEF